MITIIEQTAKGITATAGKHKVSIYLYSTGVIGVVNHNTAHKSLRGAGKTFKNIGAAMDNYSTPEIKMIIEQSYKILTTPQPTQAPPCD